MGIFQGQTDVVNVHLSLLDTIHMHPRVRHACIPPRSGPHPRVDQFLAVCLALVTEGVATRRRDEGIADAVKGVGFYGTAPEVGKSLPVSLFHALLDHGGEETDPFPVQAWCERVLYHRGEGAVLGLGHAPASGSAGNGQDG